MVEACFASSEGFLSLLQEIKNAANAVNKINALSFIVVVFLYTTKMKHRETTFYTLKSENEHPENWDIKGITRLEAPFLLHVW